MGSNVPRGHPRVGDGLSQVAHRLQVNIPFRFVGHVHRIPGPTVDQKLFVSTCLSLALVPSHLMRDVPWAAEVERPFLLSLWIQTETLVLSSS